MRRRIGEATHACPPRSRAHRPRGTCINYANRTIIRELLQLAGPTARTTRRRRMIRRSSIAPLHAPGWVTCRMTSIAHTSWGTVFAAATALAALVLSYLSFRREQNTRRETIRDRRTAQARLVTAWWTRVRQDTLEDLTLGNISGPDWPPEAGFRIWISNSSDDAIYGSMVFASIEGTPELAEQLTKNNPVSRPHITDHAKFLAIGTGTIPPRQQFPTL